MTSRPSGPGRAAGPLPVPHAAPLRILTCGSVDDGKSTLIGRLLFDTGAVYDDQVDRLARDSARFGTTGGIDYALLVDGLEDERAQGITIDIAHRTLRTERRAFQIADTPGHEEYTRNMATGASNAELAILLVDARKGLTAQTKRHAAICALMGVPAIVLAVNKMDAVGYREETFSRIAAEFDALRDRLRVSSVVAIPISALTGANLFEPSPDMPWYRGPSLLPHLETVEIGPAARDEATRFPIQLAIRPNADFRGYAGTLASGAVRVGDMLALAGAARRTRVSAVHLPSGAGDTAVAGDAVTIEVEDDLDLSRGDLLHDPSHPPEFGDRFAADLIWMSEEALVRGRQYLLRTGNRYVLATIDAVEHALDLERFAPRPADSLGANEIGLCHISTAVPIAFDRYADNRRTGSFVLIDRLANKTLAGGMIARSLGRGRDVYSPALTIDKAARSRLNNHRPAIVWFTGLSGAGKSTIADLVERRLHERGCRTYVLDGDNIRQGLNRDLGFRAADRVENIRRIGEVAKLFVDAGLLVLCSFISPFRAERQMVRESVAAEEFVEVYINAPLDVCIERDPKGLYAKARRGEIRNFTGLDSPYEAPQAPELELLTDGTRAEELAERVVALLRERGIIG